MSNKELQEAKPAGDASGTVKAASHKKPVVALTHLGFLDGLRGGAALWVLLAHCMIWGGWYGVPLPDAKIAVDVFMVLSGFLMAYLALERELLEPIGSAMTTERFWIRRFFRIAPLYYLVLAFTFIFSEPFKAGYSTLQAANPEQWKNELVYLPANAHYTLANLLMHASFLFGCFPSYAASTMLPDWSIGLEMQFYAAFPFLFLLFKRFKPVTAAIIICAAGFCLRKLTHLVLGHHGFAEHSFLPLKINTFVVGMLAASANGKFNVAPMHRFLLVLAALSMASLDSKYIVTLTALIFIMTAEINGVEPLVARVKQILAWLLGNGAARFMADTSYCVYLVHGFFIAFVGGWLFRQPDVLRWSPVERTALLTCITLIGAYTVGYFCHKFVEEPGIKLGRKVLAFRFPIAGKEKSQ